MASILAAVGVFHPIASGTLSADVVLRSTASSTLSPVTILAQFAEVLCRPLEYFRSCILYFVGRYGIFAVVAGTLSGVRVLHPAALRTLSAVTILAQTEGVLSRPTEYAKRFLWIY